MRVRVALLLPVLVQLVVLRELLAHDGRLAQLLGEVLAAVHGLHVLLEHPVEVVGLLAPRLASATRAARQVVLRMLLRHLALAHLQPKVLAVELVPQVLAPSVAQGLGVLDHLARVVHALFGVEVRLGHAAVRAAVRHAHRPDTAPVDVHRVGVGEPLGLGLVRVRDRLQPDRVRLLHEPLRRGRHVADVRVVRQAAALAHHHVEEVLLEVDLVEVEHHALLLPRVGARPRARLLPQPLGRGPDLPPAEVRRAVVDVHLLGAHVDVAPLARDPGLDRRRLAERLDLLPVGRRVARRLVALAVGDRRVEA